MNRQLMIVIFILILPIILFFVIGGILTFISKHSEMQTKFERGTLPVDLDGDYKGKAPIETFWNGKHFNAVSNTGINNIRNGDKITQGFPFKTYVGKGITDNIDVLKIDYDLPENPFYVRFVLDELVEISPEKYLGKAQLRLIPFFPITVLYFELER